MPHLTIAKQVLQFESDQIQRAIRYLTEDFNEAVNHILQHHGKIIICGIGKSGAIAQKIAATFCSTGTQAVFLNASEAIHGDLGIYADKDPVIFISKSGTTPEMLRLIPFFKERNSKIISILGNIHAPIAKESDYILNASVEKEADALNLAPTASTTVALAIGDALAVALMHARGFTENDFAKFHPGGQLGKNLLLKVQDVMHPIIQVAQLFEQSSFRELIVAMSTKNLGAACILNENKNLVGFITDGDIRRALLHETELNNISISRMMTKNPITISPMATLKEAIDLMENRASQLSVLPVIENEQCIGLLRIHDMYLK